jgi:hypothetical protein
MQVREEIKMKINENEQQPRSRAQDDLNLKDVNSYIYYMKGLAKDLLSKINSLPNVDKDGNSECPFAEDLYAQKDEFMEKVEQESQKMYRYLSLVEHEITRCRANLERISADAGSLNFDEAKKKYEAAMRSQESEYNEVIGKRKALIDLIKMVEETLSMARSKMFPGRKPQKGFRFPAGRSEGWEATQSASGEAYETTPGRPSLKNEIDNLISVGPLGRKDG